VDFAYFVCMSVACETPVDLTVAGLQSGEHVLARLATLLGAEPDVRMRCWV